MRSSNNKGGSARERKIVGGNTDKGVEQPQRHYKKFACSFWHLWLLWQQVKEEHETMLDRVGERKGVEQKRTSAGAEIDA